MGEVLKDAYEEERKKRDYKTKMGNLMYEYATVSQAIFEYQKQLVSINEKIKSLVEEFSHEGSKF